jgi:hypothetical protein
VVTPTDQGTKHCPPVPSHPIHDNNASLRIFSLWFLMSQCDRRFNPLPIGNIQRVVLSGHMPLFWKTTHFKSTATSVLGIITNFASEGYHLGRSVDKHGLQSKPAMGARPQGHHQGSWTLCHPQVWVSKVRLSTAGHWMVLEPGGDPG